MISQLILVCSVSAKVVKNVALVSARLGAITAGPKLMFNGYETWKSDSQNALPIGSQQRGAMCGRCMKTCPWNLEGLFAAEAPFRWAAHHAASRAVSR